MNAFVRLSSYLFFNHPQLLNNANQKEVQEKQGQ
jgi:hypothetical protein